MTREEAARIITIILDCCKGKEEDYEEHEIIPLEESFKALGMAIEALEQEPKRGKLIAIDDTHDQCMECGAIFCITSSDEWEVNYCPNCGAKMESDEE